VLSTAQGVVTSVVSVSLCPVRPELFEPQHLAEPSVSTAQTVFPPMPRRTTFCKPVTVVGELALLSLPLDPFPSCP